MALSHHFIEGRRTDTVGKRLIHKQRSFEANKLSPQGYIIKTVGENIFVIGADSYGVLYGVYGLLNILVDYEVYRYDEITITKKSILYIII